MENSGKKVGTVIISDNSKKTLGCFLLLVVCTFAAYFASLKDIEIQISEEISLPYSGFSSSLPYGPGWQISKGWNFSHENNLFFIASVFKDNKTEVGINWRYLIDRQELTPFDKVQKRAQDLETEIKRSGEIRHNSLILYWANFYVVPKAVDIYYGVLRLSDERYIELEIISSDTDLAWSSFKAVADKFSYSPNLYLIYGKKLIQDTISNQLSNVAEQQDASYFIYKLQTQPIGFMAEVTNQEPEDKTFVRNNLAMLKTKNGPIQESNKFKCPLDFTEFSWQITQNLGSKDKETFKQLNMSNTRTLSIISSNHNQIQKKINETAFPELLQDLLFKEFMDFNSDVCMVDFITSQGQLMPVLMKKVTHSAAVHRIDLYYLNSTMPSEEVYVDNNGRILRSMLKLQNINKFRATYEGLIEYFSPYEDLLKQLLY